MNLFPTSPLLAPDGSLVSLGALRGNLKATPVALDAETPVGNLTVSTQQMSVSVAGKLAVGSIFTSSVQANEAGFWMDAMQFADSAFRQDVTDIVNQTRWGYGLRILCRAQQLDATFNLNFAALGAAVDLGLATVSYEVQTIGLGPTALSAILKGLSQFGALSGETFHDLNTAVIQNLSDLIAHPPAALTPRPIAVQLNIPVSLDPVVEARSDVFAIRRIRDGMSLTAALTRAGAKYDPVAIRAAYQAVAPGIADGTAPDGNAKAFAKKWLG